jgi:hypothetical protein
MKLNLSDSFHIHPTTLILILLISSCNFNFPEEIQEPVFSTDQKFHFNIGSSGGTISFALADSGNDPYRIIVYPQWMDIKKFDGTLDNGSCTIPFEFKNVENFISMGRAEGNVYIKHKNIILQITVSYGVNTSIQPPADGQVPMYCSTAEIDFGTENNRSFTIANHGQVDKSWYIANIPPWLQLSETSGYLEAGRDLTLFCTVSYEGMAPGEYSQIIHVESDNPQLSHGILVKMTVPPHGAPVNSSAVNWFDGTVADAYFCKTTDYLYILTKSPNNLLVKEPGTDSLKTYPLERIPNCIDVTADGKTIAIGYNQAYVDLLDAETMNRIKLYEADCVPYDLVFGENGWCYLSPTEDQWVHLYSLNLTSGVTFRTSTSNLYEKSVLVKMPGKPLLYYTRPQLSPSGVQIVNIENGAANDTIPGWHEDTGPMIWLSKSGDKIFGANKNIYRTPDYTKETFHLSLPRTGKIDIPRNYIKSLDYNENLQCFFAVGTDYWWGAYNAEIIYQVNEISYSAEKSVKAGTYPGYLNNQHNPSMDVHYVFSNREGTKLFAVKNVNYNLEMNFWALEIFELPLK